MKKKYLEAVSVLARADIHLASAEYTRAVATQKVIDAKNQMESEEN